MKELRRIVIGEMTEKVRVILSSTESDGLQWKGTKTDLLELLHEVYYHCGITMDDGSYATFSYLVAHAFRVFGIIPPRNPRARASRAENRKGMRSASLVRRIEAALSSPDGREALDRLWKELCF
ncbi:MAG: hypothetical protein NC344_02210 [Bacteroidales bacterium]|nr:hypothetical protein [Bacteroidales bacterium]MCM1146646.1 hypothetical protein [Bacteroidales bacterium]MCM1206038.1 hypothetical protein [Bacillota bacterium]MCM1511062.1 hypothetical protein [Clostridium sp.]